jgi:class 3 adenylate cyclase
VEIKRVALVLADISGYTRFMKLHTVSLLHAEVIITDLLEAMLDHAEYPLTLSKLEGDAAFLYVPLAADGDARAVTQDVLRQVTAFVEAFKTRERELIACNACTCEACLTIGQLKLKAFLHVGEAAISQIRQFEELAGEDVIVIHRLMKNSIPAKEYIVVTEAFYELSGGLAGQTPEARTEECEGIGPVPVRVYYPIGEEPPRPPRPAPFSPKSPEYKALSARLDTHVARRMQGREPPPNFAHLPNARLTPLDWLRVVWEIVVWSMTDFPKLWREHRGRKP